MFYYQRLYWKNHQHLTSRSVTSKIDGTRIVKFTRSKQRELLRLVNWWLFKWTGIISELITFLNQWTINLSIGIIYTVPWILKVFHWTFQIPNPCIWGCSGDNLAYRLKRCLILGLGKIKAETYPNLSQLIPTYPNLSQLIPTYPNLSHGIFLGYTTIWSNKKRRIFWSSRIFWGNPPNINWGTSPQAKTFDD